MNSSLKGLLLSAPLFASMLTAVGCAGDATSSGDDEIVLGLSDLKDRVTVEPDQLVFDADLVGKPKFDQLLARISDVAQNRASEPVYLVGDRATGALQGRGELRLDARNATGYMRKALSWSKNDKGEIVVKTEKATLPEVARELAANGFRGVNNSNSAPQNIDRSRGAGIWSADWDETFGGTRSFDLRNLRIPFGPFRGKTFAEAPLFQAKAPSGEVILEARVKQASIDLTPRTNGSVIIHGLSTNDVDINLSAEANAAFEVEITATLPDAARINAQQGGTFELAKIGGTFQGFPLTLEAWADWECSTQVDGGMNFSIGMKANGHIAAGATVKDFGVSMKPMGLDYGFERIGPTGAAAFKAEQRCSLTPRIALQIFDSAGPEAGLELWEHGDFNVNGSVQAMSLEASTAVRAGGELRFGGALRPFGVNVAELTMDPTKFGPFELLPRQTYRFSM